MGIAIGVQSLASSIYCVFVKQSFRFLLHTLFTLNLQLHHIGFLHSWVFVRNQEASVVVPFRRNPSMHMGPISGNSLFQSEEGTRVAVTI